MSALWESFPPELPPHQACENSYWGATFCVYQVWESIHTELKSYCTSENTWDKVQEAAQIIAFVPFKALFFSLEMSYADTEYEK